MSPIVPRICSSTYFKLLMSARNTSRVVSNSASAAQGECGTYMAGCSARSESSCNPSSLHTFSIRVGEYSCLYLAGIQRGGNSSVPTERKLKSFWKLNSATPDAISRRGGKSTSWGKLRLSNTIVLGHTRVSSSLLFSSLPSFLGNARFLHRSTVGSKHADTSSIFHVRVHLHFSDSHIVSKENASVTQTRSSRRCRFQPIRTV